MSESAERNLWRPEAKESRNRRIREQIKRIAGKSYTTFRSRKKKRAIKPPGRQVRCKCPYSCREIAKTNPEWRKTLFAQYREPTMTYIAQMNYLLGLMEIMPIKRRRHGTYATPDASRRQCTIAFRLPGRSGSYHRVCKRTFMETFGITTQIVATLVKRKKQGETVFKEKRGGARTSRHKLATRLQVREHIDSIPRDVSHYRRARTGTREYLSSDWTVTKLYRAFKRKYPDCDVSIKYYTRVFRTDFPNLAFRPPSMDTCKTCDRLNLLSQERNEEGRNAKERLDAHHEEAERLFNAVSKDFEASTLPGSTACTVTIDLQKVIPLPQLTHSSMYYARQLSCYNFGIHVADTNDGIMCIWHEGVAGRGGNEIASCLLHALNTGQLNTSKRHLIIYSDNCAAQLKNKMMLYLYLALIVTGVFDRIDHKFLVSGHSFSASDRDFALVEKAARKSKLRVPQDVIHCVQSARVVRPFKVIDLTDKPFFDFSTKVSMLLSTAGMRISQLGWLRIDHSDLTAVYCKTAFSETEPFRRCPILKPHVDIQTFRHSILELEALQGLPLMDEDKLEDLFDMLDYMDSNSRSFYEDLLTTQISLR